MRACIGGEASWGNFSARRLPSQVLKGTTGGSAAPSAPLRLLPALALGSPATTIDACVSAGQELRLQARHHAGDFSARGLPSQVLRGTPRGLRPQAHRSASSLRCCSCWRRLHPARRSRSYGVLAHDWIPRRRNTKRDSIAQPPWPQTACHARPRSGYSSIQLKGNVGSAYWNSARPKLSLR